MQQDDVQRPFGRYARYYDALYETKDYRNEARYVIEIASTYGSALPDPLSVLDLGCGTGRHLFAMKELRPTFGCGVDLSAEMIEQARAADASKTGEFVFDVHDARTFRAGTQYDLVMSLFHVFSYQVDDAHATEFLRTARAHMKEDSVLVFDFWFGPAVEADPPVWRQRDVRVQDQTFRRTATPTVLSNARRVNVHYDVEVLGANPPERFEEDHAMRYWFADEVKDLATAAGLEVIGLYKSGTVEPPSKADWNCTACCVVDHSISQ
jgi:SAM-dependent methyltransferase